MSMACGLARLKTRADFLRVAAVRNAAVTPSFILQAARRRSAEDSGEPVRVGYTASRRVGNAVVRNRAKRRLRAAAAEVLPRLGRPGTDYVLVARAVTGERAYPALIVDLEAALHRVGAAGTGAERASARRVEMGCDCRTAEDGWC